MARAAYEAEHEGEAMMTMDERVEAAARAIAIAHGTDPDQEARGLTHAVADRGDGIPALISDHRGKLWEMWIVDARAALAAAFPELSGDKPTHWLAPMEATEGMMAVSYGACDPEDWARARDAYLGKGDGG